jgi:sugar transferase (PEP-CTERM/EpsH1 system associated)
MSDSRLLIAHVVDRFAAGQGERVVELVNRMDPQSFRHMVVVFSECDSALARRIAYRDVRCVFLRRRPWHLPTLVLDLYNLFRLFPPQVVHTGDLAAAVALFPAAAARVPVRIQGIDNADLPDSDGIYIGTWFRFQFHRLFAHHYTVDLRQLARCAIDDVGIDPRRLSLIRKGVDSRLFHSVREGRELLMGSPFNASRLVVVGSIGALDHEHDPVRLVRAFSKARRMFGAYGARLRLVMAGDGPLRREVKAAIEHRGLADVVWLAGKRTDLPELLRSFDFFALCEHGGDAGNVVLSAMASGLPVVALRDSVQCELVKDGQTGFLVSSDTQEIGVALARLAADTNLRLRQGQAARERVMERFELDSMVKLHANLYRFYLDANHDRKEKTPADGDHGRIQETLAGTRTILHAARRRSETRTRCEA